jgi:MFS family permease
VPPLQELFAGTRGRVAAGLLVSEFVAATQGLVIAAIMPRVVADLHGVGAYALAFGAFYAAFMIFMPFAGPLADRRGLRFVLSIGLGLLAAGLALVSVAPTMLSFVGARFVEGIGDGLDYALSFAVVAKAFPAHLRARMLSLNTTMWVVPGLFAPALGAYVAVTLGWRWAFAGLLPLIAVAAALILPALDVPASDAPSDPFAALRLLFSRATLRAAPGLHAALAAFALLHAAFFGADAYVALMLTSVRGLSLQAASICITLAVLGWSCAAIAAPALLKRRGLARIVLLAAVASALGTAMLAAVALGAPVGLAFFAWYVGGAGMGLGYPTLSAAIVSEAPHGREGAVSSATASSALAGLLAGTLLCGLPVTAAAYLRVPYGVALAATFAIAAFLAAVLAAVAPRTGDGFGGHRMPVT